jgi:hypothetical protein
MVTVGEAKINGLQRFEYDVQTRGSCQSEVCRVLKKEGPPWT